MKKVLISLLLAVVMVFTAASAFAAPIDIDNAVVKFLDETDLEAKDIALQMQSGNKNSELVIRVEKDGVHLLTRDNGTEKGHVQINPTGIYAGSANAVQMLRFATVADAMEEIVKSVDDKIEQAIQSIPEGEIPTEAEVNQAVEMATAEIYAAFAQEQADAATLSAAATEFASKFKPEYILDVKEEDGSVEISLRSGAYATALAEAMDGLMTNPALAELVDRNAAQRGGRTFAQYQRQWMKERAATLEAIRSVEGSEKLEENGHWTSHLQINGEDENEPTLIYDTDAWIDVDYQEAKITAALGIEGEEPFMVYEAAVSPYFYEERMTSGNSVSDVTYTIKNNRVSGGRVITVLDGREELRAEFGSDYLFAKGPNGSVSTTVRETWLGKTRYELIAETAAGETARLIVDFYEDNDSLVCELILPDESDETLMFKISRIDKAAMDDLSASGNITEIPADQVSAVLKALSN